MLPGKSWAKVRAQLNRAQKRKEPTCGLFRSSPGWTRTNNPPVNRLMAELDRASAAPCKGCTSVARLALDLPAPDDLGEPRFILARKELG
jgi:hypothetical protein